MSGIRRCGLSLGVTLAIVVAGSCLRLDRARAEAIFPPGRYPQLDELMARHGRQFYLFNARPFGLALDYHYADEQARALIEQFLAQEASDDVQAVTGKHPFEMAASYGEFGDLGFFGGVALAGLAFEYLALKREGGPAERLELVRSRLLHGSDFPIRPSPLPWGGMSLGAWRRTRRLRGNLLACDYAVKECFGFARESAGRAARVLGAG